MPKKLADHVLSTMNSIKVEPKECNEKDWTAQLNNAGKQPQIVVSIRQPGARQVIASNIVMPAPEHHTTLRNQVTKCAKIDMTAGTQKATTTFEEVDLGISGDVETFATRSVTTGFDGAKETAFEAHVNVRHRALYYRVAGTDDEQLFRTIVERGVTRAAAVR
ncbi:hypothetical protein GOARA_068_00680 [Gordonia araii NBRC 100433]|uniref:Uncharacterized protein n=1 Tax=Gordonia araii NBRC 100433 TaxID=1073574 RepID=G7H6D4_9ACTN|nr:hypothetical protein [Gordonia araii]NNG96089.1 hypothetical protein [Gordonia araii NBRC 100433]GAB11409.1 hypothetical protein GOARA_068_00680 [Gordonia araii NBRC 100433]